MLETNIRIVRPGSKLFLWTRRAEVQGQDKSPDLLQRSCNLLRRHHKLAAVPIAGQESSLLIATQTVVPTLQLQGDGWLIDVRDAGESNRKLVFADGDKAQLLSSLVERALIIEIARKTDFWALDSPRIWYQDKPFQSDEGIAAFRRFEIGSFIIDDVGIGVAVDVGTAFFSTHTLAYFLDSKISGSERHRRQALFSKLTGRQQGQKGTLLYNNGRSKTKCYFETAPEGVTCGNTGKIRVRNKNFDSLYTYYQTEYPEASVSENTPAVRVLFPGLDHPQWVAADRLHIRVMNDDLPSSLSSFDKISPVDRRVLLQNFWDLVEPTPLGKVAPGFQEGFWSPPPSRISRFIPVEVEFADGQILPAPSLPSTKSYREYYRQRLEYLENAGCYSVPPAVNRTIYCVYPRTVGEKAALQLAGDIANQISKWTKRSFIANLAPYDSISEAIKHLRMVDNTGTAIFVLDEEPAAYFEVAFQLSGWRIKRITEGVLKKQFRNLSEGAWDKNRKASTLERGQGLWHQFITMNALDVIQQMDIVPWRTGQLGLYEAQLVIDVGHDRRHFALSLLIARSQSKTPSFGLYSEVSVKSDPKHETINRVMLEDQIVQIFEQALRRRFDPIRSVLVVRDGALYGSELQGIERGMTRLIEQEMIGKNAHVDIVDFHKDSLKSVRLWDLDDSKEVRNPLEGTGVLLNNQMMVVTPTGSATLHQGTAQPFVLVGNGRCARISDAANMVFGAAQLNWSSPIVAQRLPLPLKRTDEELTSRASQEIRRIR